MIHFDKDPTLKDLAAQIGLKAEGHYDGELDNWFGAKSQAALAEFARSKRPGGTPTSGNWPKRNTSAMESFFGHRGTNQVLLDLPYPMRLSWNLSQTVNRMSCNARIEEPLARIFQKALDHYGMEQIKALRLDVFGGCLNVRKMRGGSEWSVHSWGAAVDLDPDRNQLAWGRDRAAFAKPEYDAFWGFVEEEGGYSLGRRENRDWMHFEFTSGK